MRLICPNCGAQYEVDARVVPDGGRDVQCSNCGHTWFQNPDMQDVDLADEMGIELPQQDEGHIDIPLPDEPPRPDFSAAIEDSISSAIAQANQPDEQDAQQPEKTAPHHGESIEFAPETHEDPISEVEASINPTRKTPIKSGISDSVRDILRAEAQFDQSTRPHDADTLETQPELGIEEPTSDPSKKSLRERMARLRGLDADDAATAGTGTAPLTGKRKDLLPDIEEINSTLSASSERNEDGTVPDEETLRDRSTRRSSRVVFLLIVLTAALLVLLYIFAPQLARANPSLAPALEFYISGANAFRDWLDAALTGASDRLNGLLSQLNS